MSLVQVRVSENPESRFEIESESALMIRMTRSMRQVESREASQPPDMPLSSEIPPMLRCLYHRPPPISLPRHPF